MWYRSNRIKNGKSKVKSVWAKSQNVFEDQMRKGRRAPTMILPDFVYSAAGLTVVYIHTSHTSLHCCFREVTHCPTFVHLRQHNVIHDDDVI